MITKLPVRKEQYVYRLMQKNKKSEATKFTMTMN